MEQLQAWMFLKGLSDVSLEAGAAAALHLSVIGGVMFPLESGSGCNIHNFFPGHLHILLSP